MSVGGRNRLMTWTGATIPYKPGKNDLLDATRRASAVFKAGGVVAIAGEGRIHAREAELLPLSEGAAYFALRSGVPLVPVAIRGTSWLRVRRARPGRGGGADPGRAAAPNREAVDGRDRRDLAARSTASSPTPPSCRCPAASGAG